MLPLYGACYGRDCLEGRSRGGLLVRLRRSGCPPYPHNLLSNLYGEAVEVAVTVAVIVAVAEAESEFSRVVLGVVFSGGGAAGDARSVRSGNAAGVEGLSGRFNTNARAAPATNGTTTATHTSRTTKAVYLGP
jgi:hypothetical protein